MYTLYRSNEKQNKIKIERKWTRARAAHSLSRKKRYTNNTKRKFLLDNWVALQKPRSADRRHTHTHTQCDRRIVDGAEKNKNTTMMNNETGTREWAIVVVFYLCLSSLFEISTSRSLNEEVHIMNFDETKKNKKLIYVEMFDVSIIFLWNSTWMWRVVRMYIYADFFFVLLVYIMLMWCSPSSYFCVLFNM